MVFLKEGCTHCACRYFKQPLAQTSTYSLPHWHSLAMPAEVQGGQPLGQHASQQAVWLSSCSVLTTTPTACEKPQPSSCWKNRWAHLSIRLLYFFLPGQVKYGERCAKKKESISCPEKNTSEGIFVALSWRVLHPCTAPPTADKCLSDTNLK